MASAPAHSRLAASALAAVLIVGLLSTPAHAAPSPGNDISLPPLGTAHAAPSRAARPTSSAGLADDAVARAYQQWRKGTFTQHKGVRKGALRVQVSHDKGGSAAATARKLGATNVTEVTPTVFVADVPFDKLRSLQGTSSVDTVKVPPRVNILPEDDTLAAAPPAGTDGGEILDKTNAAAWQSAGITGTDVKIGVIDYFSASVRDSAYAAGEVKESSIATQTFCRSNGTSCSVWGSDTEHGVAVLEILNDIAPGATIYVATADTLADTKAAIDFFAANGVTIVTRSLTSSYDGPGNGTGPSADLVDYAVSKGIAWFNAAGNAGRVLTTVDDAPAYVGGYWRGGWQDTNSNGWLEFTGNGETPSEFMPVDCGYFNGLRWNDWGESGKTDYDLYASVLDSEGNETYIARSESDQGSGADPVEGSEANFSDQYSFSNIDCDAHPWYYVSVRQYARGTSNADILEILVNTDLYFFAANAGAAAQPFVDSKNPGLSGVGAVDPVAGTDAAYYSSQGPTNDGRVKPDLATGSGFSSYSYRNEGGAFHGTSASSPAAAGIAALVLDQTSTATDSATPAQLMTYLKHLAVVDRGAAGTDNVFGAGEVVLGGTSAFTGAASVSFADPTVGVPVTATVTGLNPDPILSWQWYNDGAPIAGATGATYTPVGSLEGHALSVKAIAGTRDDLPVLVASSSKSVAQGTLVAGTPVIGGTPTIGKALVANPGTWTAGTKFTYEWLRNGAAFGGPNSATYTLTSADFGKALTVRVTGSQIGYAPQTKTSAPKSGFARGTLSAPVPAIKGNLAVGQVATAAPWTWTRGTTLTYQWYSNGKAISGARSSTLKIGKTLKDKTLSVKVTGSLTGYNTVTKSSATTKKLLLAAVPKISGTTKVGSTLKVSRGTWSSKVKFSYKWFRNGVAISRATTTKYTLTKSDKGKRITVKVTGKRTGYVTVTLTSAPTAAIR